MKCLNFFLEQIKRLGTPTPDSLDRLRKMELDCSERKDPNSFYVMFHLNNLPTVVWSHNLDRHLGVASLDFEQYISLIHPSWLPIHQAFAATAYIEGQKIYDKHRNSFAVYTNNVPIRHKDGTYHWFNQVSVPAAFDSNGQLTCYLNQYHRLCSFDQLVPTKPKLTVDGIWNSEVDDELSKAANEALAISLSELLTPANQQLLHAYRRLAKNTDGKWIPPAKKIVRETIGLSPNAINKANVRIIHSLKEAFPGCVTNDVAGFACFLNDIFGAPRYLSPEKVEETYR